MDLCEEVIGSWRGQCGAVAAMTLVWGRPLVSGGRIATAELADLAVDQCELIEERFTLIAPDDYRHDLLEIKLFDVKGRELARESLYAGEDEARTTAAMRTDARRRSRVLRRARGARRAARPISPIRLCCTRTAPLPLPVHPGSARS